MSCLFAQNTDILHHVLTFLIDDGTSVARLGLSSRELYERIMRQQETTFYPNLWKIMINYRWIRTRSRPAIDFRNIESISNNNNSENSHTTTTPISHRGIYIEKRRADAEAIRRLEQMASDLQTVLQLNETNTAIVADKNAHIGRAWSHHGWNFLLRNRADCYDVLKSIARRTLVGNNNASSSSVTDRLLGFLAARCVQGFHFTDSLCKWKKVNESNSEVPQTQTQASQLKKTYLLEQYVLLICEIQKTPLEILHNDDFHRHSIHIQGNNSDEDNQASAQVSKALRSLDEIARVCADRMHEKLRTNASVTAKVKVVNDVLVNHYGFSGNTEDYYNYRNVLLDHVIESKTGMPLTLCILYSCICRRLGIAVQLIGLPGHIVLAVDTGDESNAATERLSFIDVFHGCRILSTDHCRQIVASYGIGWREEFLAPLATEMSLQRIFNNLRNCHEKGMSLEKPPLFCSDLMFQQLTVDTIHQYPADIANSVLQRLTHDLPLVLSPGLLRAYNLLSHRCPYQNPVVDSGSASLLLELSSYVGLSYHNYA